MRKQLVPKIALIEHILAAFIVIALILRGFILHVFVTFNQNVRKFHKIVSQKIALILQTCLFRQVVRGVTGVVFGPNRQNHSHSLAWNRRVLTD